MDDPPDLSQSEAMARGVWPMVKGFYIAGSDRTTPISMRNIDDLLTKGHRQYTPLGRLLRSAADQQAWTAELQALLPPTLRNSVRVTTLNGPQLTLACRSAAAATRLRFAVPELLPKLRSLGHFADVEDVRVKVA